MYWLLGSSIGRKFVMSISGVFLVLFLLLHMSMNLVLIFSTKAYDKICGVLGANWYAVVATLILTGGFSIHIAYGTLLTFHNMRARGIGNYEIPNETKIEWASKNMFVLGLIVILGLIIHLWNFWYKMQFAELFQSGITVKEGSRLVISLFSSPIFSFTYILWLVALWFHLTHGIWSIFQTLGWNNKKWFPRLRFISNIVSTIIMIGFAVVPIYFTIYTLIK
ncbi:MAG: succinate dehydrogenase/fumarate reductase cytochrome b subunit [Candidatus Azobacteroides pseudotrichonymphae]|uniref:Fumarate reductase cytochrome b subunit n=2 Tax=Candidatus Azobacteroides TaxID=511434 RepID=B6YR94_AZOPC|nr:fumarate reductase cytochrome b subunit [Candidatus Azobacteroides pseudotrichonymphae genomovar. CFP2]GMO34816.1 MAG: succinate dehydrogenase/fumarate reductase cytochrome b subunit [Candidatus Azobacteroides pseudotrichonymphae]